ncbi:hypothetical protein OG943_40985 [Amycolatopsis sp. NBC_00345]|uniref:hypothetical protein n=1 Tax=Amycolatopsis sp. NBC_00345 TaxID=2975955 RepID=UPI002E2577F8
MSDTARDAAAFSKLVRAWELEYQGYIEVWPRYRSDRPTAAAQNAANSAQRMSDAWLGLANSCGLPWRCVAAVDRRSWS